MTDPYEYFFQKLGFKIIKKSELQRSNSLKNFYDYNDGFELVWDFFENNHQFGIWIDDRYKKKDVCRYAYINLHSEYFKDNLNSAAKNFSKPFINNFNIIIQTLKNFPDRLTSTSEIDILLTLNGLNKT